jgi:hypothetical protein
MGCVCPHSKLDAQHVYTFLVDKICSTFPWYKRLNNLMGTSPVVDESALANSVTPLDLSVLSNFQASNNELAQVENEVSLSLESHDYRSLILMPF